MTAENGRRLFKRCYHQIPIQASYFNSTKWVKAQALDYSSDGIRFRSNCYFHENATLLIRAEYNEADNPYECQYEGFPTVTIGDVRWCREIQDATSSSYEVGIKYLPSPY